MPLRVKTKYRLHIAFLGIDAEFYQESSNEKNELAPKIRKKQVFPKILGRIMHIWRSCSNCNFQNHTF